MKIVYYRMCKLYLVFEVLFQLLIIPAIVMMVMLGWNRYWMIAATLPYWWNNSPWFPWDSKFKESDYSDEDCGNTVSTDYVGTVEPIDTSRKLTTQEYQCGRFEDDDGTIFEFSVECSPNKPLTVDDVKQGFWWEDDHCYMISTNVVTMPPVEEKKEI